MTPQTSRLYEQIGKSTIEAIITRFYSRCLNDPMIQHFFWKLDHEQLSRMQVDFVTGILGGPSTYRGRPLSKIHNGMNIRTPHFMRRQQLLRESMEELGLDGALATSWLELEAKLMPLVLDADSSCRH